MSNQLAVPQIVRHTGIDRQRRLLFVAGVLGAMSLLLAGVYGRADSRAPVYDREASVDSGEVAAAPPALVQLLDGQASAGQATAAGPGAIPQPRAGLPRLTLDVKDRYYATVGALAMETFRDYEAISISIPSPSVASSRQVSSRGGELSARLQVRTPYWINDAPGEANQMKAVAGASEEFRQWFRHLPVAARQGKGSPRQIQAVVQSAVDRGFVVGAAGGPPTTADVEAWMKKFGIGVDCSGFVYEALLRAGSSLAFEGWPGIARPFGGPPTYVGSRSLSQGGERIAGPKELLPGDLMYMAPDAQNEYGHIRIIDEVRLEGGSVVFHTVESTQAGVGGPAERWWRFPAGERFADLATQVDGRWEAPEAREHSAVYSRRISEPERAAELVR